MVAYTYLYCPAVGFEFEDVDKPMPNLMSVSSVPDSKPVISRMIHLSNSSARRECAWVRIRAVRDEDRAGR